MKKNQPRTYPLKGLSIFLSIVLTICIGFSIAMIFINEQLGIKIVIWVFAAIFGVLSFVVLVKEALVYISLDDEKEMVIIHDFLHLKKIPLKQISRIENKDGFYVFYKKDKKFYSLGADRKGANEFILELEAREIKIGW